MSSPVETAMDRKKITVYVPEDVYERVKALAAADRRSVASWALLAVEERLKAQDQKNRPARGGRS